MYGASLGSLFLFSTMPGRYHTHVISEIEGLSPEGLSNLLRSADYTTDTSHYLMSTGPLPNDRTIPERKVTSPYVLEECCERILKNEVEAMRKLYDMLHCQPDSSTAAGMLFEYRAHQFC